MRVAVAGGTGAVGARVVEAARERGHEVVSLSRSGGVDLEHGTGLAAALAGADAVVDTASVSSRSAERSRAFFGAVTRNLLAAEAAAGVGHHVLLSIVGIDRSPYDYYAGKVLQEELVEATDVPWTILRATQFHEFARQIHGAVTAGPFVLVPRMRSQPIAAREVGERLVDLVEAGPSGRVADLAGPRPEWIGSMVRRYARAIGDRRPVIAVPLPGPGGRAQRDGTLIPDAVAADHGRETFEQWLASLVPPR
ncbi:SDR family oxidoreductase [Galbitalea sp. SE-J8]|uniref:SDR family oxidoreductase n=1 Tax=Galbitalea sp. SE-J8 TaxID=3054952 RepID=UPI00259C85FB|nr:SDR family oxidoreductase [Galbitalea sp. SE-J8]MDM4761596.1 SDR family oxidoreductase [Galbitalea sp. SE-J8]